MSDEPTPKDNGAEWSMPEPIFRSSEGHTPKAKSYAYADDIDTLAPDTDDVDQDDIDTEIPNVPEGRDEAAAAHFDEVNQDDIPTEIPNRTDADAEARYFDEVNQDDIPTEIPNVENSVDLEESSVGTQEDRAETVHPEQAAMPKGGCAQTVMMVVGVMAFMAVIITVAVLYLLSYLGTAESGAF